MSLGLCADGSWQEPMWWHTGRRFLSIEVIVLLHKLSFLEIVLGCPRSPKFKHHFSTSSYFLGFCSRKNGAPCWTVYLSFHGGGSSHQGLMGKCVFIKRLFCLIICFPTFGGVIYSERICFTIGAINPCTCWHILQEGRLLQCSDLQSTLPWCTRDQLSAQIMFDMCTRCPDNTGKVGHSGSVTSCDPFDMQAVLLGSQPFCPMVTFHRLLK